MNATTKDNNSKFYFFLNFMPDQTNSSSNITNNWKNWQRCNRRDSRNLENDRLRGTKEAFQCNSDQMVTGNSRSEKFATKGKLLNLSVAHSLPQK